MSWIQSDLLKSETTYVPCEWSTGTDAEIVEALEKHYAGQIDLTDYWAIGDERTVHLSAMSAMSPLSDTHEAQDIILVLTEVGGKELTTPINGHTECVFQVDQKSVLSSRVNTTMVVGAQSSDLLDYRSTPRKTWLDSTYYNAMPSTLKPIFKQFKNICENYSKSSTYTFDAYFSFRAQKEISGTNLNTSDFNWDQIEYYKTSINIYKGEHYQYGYWTLTKSSNGGSSTIQFNTIAGKDDWGDYTMSISNRYGTDPAYIAPFGVI